MRPAGPRTVTQVGSHWPLWEARRGRPRPPGRSPERGAGGRTPRPVATLPGVSWPAGGSAVPQTGKGGRPCPPHHSGLVLQAALGATAAPCATPAGRSRGEAQPPIIGGDDHPRGESEQSSARASNRWPPDDTPVFFFLHLLFVLWRPGGGGQVAGFHRGMLASAHQFLPLPPPPKQCQTPPSLHDVASGHDGSSTVRPRGVHAAEGGVRLCD